MHIAREEPDEANQYASTAFVLLLGILFVMLLPFLLFVIYFPSLLDVAAGHEMESRIVVLLLGGNILLPLVFNPHMIGLYSEQRFDDNYIEHQRNTANIFK